MPAVQRATDASTSALGVALLAVAVGALPAMLGGGVLVDAIGTRLVPIALVAFGVAAMTPALARSVPVLFVLLLVVGATSGLLDVAVNADASRIETAFRVRVMDGLHAAFSVGVLLGGVGAGLSRRAGASPSWILFAVGALVVGSAWLNRAAGATTPRRARRLRPGRGLLLVGAVLALAFLVENGVEQWSALYLERRLDASPAVSGLGPGLFAGAMAAGRLLAQRVGRVGVTQRMVVAGVTAATGIALAVSVRHALVALAGFVVAGLGLSLSAPTLLGVAGRVGGDEARGAAVSTVAVLGYVGFLAGPPLIGAVSSASTVRGGFIFLGAVAVLLAACAPALRESPR